LNELHIKITELDRFYSRTINDLLIGINLATCNTDLLTEYNRSIEAEYKSQFEKLKQEYQHIRDMSTAYADLLNARYG
jgi:hypothetical protein